MIRTGMLFLAGFCVALSAGWWSVPRILYREEPQPVQFSHIARTGEKGGMSCEDCHAFREDGTFAGIPKLETCAACHSAPMGETQAEKDFIARFVEPGVEPQWKSSLRQPDNAWFPHSAHVLRGKVACEKCHGDIGKSGKLTVYRVHRFTGYPEDVMGKRAGPLGLMRAGGMRMEIAWPATGRTGSSTAASIATSERGRATPMKIERRDLLSLAAGAAAGAAISPLPWRQLGDTAL